MLTITTSGNNITPKAENDGRYEDQQMSLGLVTEEKDTLPSQTSSAVIEDFTKPRTSSNNSFRKLRDPSETSLEALERTHSIAKKKKPKTSLEAIECAHHLSRTSVEPTVLTRNDNDPRQKSSSTLSVKAPPKIPRPSAYSDDVPSTHPSLISLPLSSSEPSSSEKSEPSISWCSESFNLYRENNIRLSRHFSHLRCVCSSSRHDRARITIFDYGGKVLQDLKHLSIDFMLDNGEQSEHFTSSKLDECHSFICSINSLIQVETRLVIVEDLGPSLINLLGATFNLSPEFFEEHLHRSNYGGAQAQGQSPSSWRTSNLQKNYASFAWYRPGESWALGIERGGWEDYLNHITQYVEMETQCLDQNGQVKATHHDFVAKTNIFRWPAEISTDPAGRLPDKVPCGWQERATLCNVEVNGIHYGAC